jgi:hypothetical protein
MSIFSIKIIDNTGISGDLATLFRTFASCTTKLTLWKFESERITLEEL